MNASESPIKSDKPVRRVLIALTVGVIFILGMTIWTWVVNGALTASQVLTDFAMPVGIVWMSLFVYASWLFLNRRRLEFCFVISLWFLIAITFNGKIAGKLISSVETPRNSNLLDDASPLRSMIVLGGSVFVASDGVVEVSPHGQRVVLAAQYWHAGKTQSIVVSGGQAVTENEPHSKNVRSMLESLNVPSEVIFEVSSPTNTTAEMQDLVQFFSSAPEGLPTDGDVALVTSAFHMKRAMRLAEDTGLDEVVDLMPMPCGYRTGASFGFTPRSYLPRANSGNAFAVALKERLAVLVGR